jgi:hypothetical protein
MTTRTWSPVRTAVSSALAVGFLISAAVIWQSSRAAFFGNTYNQGNHWSAGTVKLVDNDSDGALFDASNLKPGGAPETACIMVTYQGSLDAAVKVYVKPADLTHTSPLGSLGPYINLTIEEGDGDVPFGTACTNFSATSTIFNGTLEGASDGIATHYTDFSTGRGAWTPAAAPPDRNKSYRFTYSLKDDNNAQGKDATVKFTWEAQNT